MMNELDFLATVERLLPTWRDVFSPEDTQSLAAWLQETPRDDSEAVRQTVNRTLDLLQRYPSAKSDLGQASNPEDPREGVRLLYSQLAGGPQGVQAHTRELVCPKDPSHYRRQPMFPGERVFCPVHKVALVDPDSLPSKE